METSAKCTAHCLAMNKVLCVNGAIKFRKIVIGAMTLSFYKPITPTKDEKQADETIN